MGLENPLHLAIVLLVVLMVFGAKRLPEMGRGLGDGMRGFKEAISGTGGSASAQVAASTDEPAAAEPAVTSARQAD